MEAIKKNVSFGLVSKNTSGGFNTGEVSFQIGEYASAPHDKAQKYFGEEEKISLGVTGGYGLTGASAKQVKSGETVSFNHTLRNTGGVYDEFEITANNGNTAYHLVLKSGNVVLASDVNGDGLWDEINEEYQASGKLVIPVKAGETIPLAFEAEIPKATPKGTNSTITLSAKGKVVNTDTVNAQDTIDIIGEAINGWTGNPYFLNDNLPDSVDEVKNKLKDQWKERYVVPGNALKLEAIASSDITGVKAIIQKVDGTIVGEAMALKASNESTSVAKGYALWDKVNYLIPADIELGRYFVKFDAYGSGSILESDDTKTDDENASGYNNYFMVLDKVNLTGTITGKGLDDNPAIVLSHASVRLYDMAGSLIGETITNDQGTYIFQDIKPVVYTLAAESEDYKKAGRKVDVLALVDQGIAKADVQLVKFTMNLTANPSTIVGDGKSTSVLSTQVLDSNGNPIKDVTVAFDAPVGSFPDGKTAKTDEKGIATVKYKSEKIEGLVSQVIPVKATVDHTEGNLHLFAEEYIFITFEPASITGRVMDSRYEKDANGNIIYENGKVKLRKVPVEGALVEVLKDFDGDGIIDFYSSFITGPDGSYKIAIPKGGVQYEVRITKSLILDEKNHTAKEVTFIQKVEVKEITGDGQEEFIADKTLVGVILTKNTDGKSNLCEKGTFKDNDGNPVSLGIVARDSAGNDIPGVNASISENGTFQVENIPMGVSEFSIDIEYLLPGGEKLIIGTAHVVVDINGDISIGEALIDPYGTITNKDTGDVISGVNVNLYYGNNGNAKDGTLVPLPAVVGFAPSDNANPQISDAGGQYAFMVFPNSKYYIIAIKPGYDTYDSRNNPDTDATQDKHITVFLDIVKYDFSMTPSNSGGGGNSPGSKSGGGSGSANSSGASTIPAIIQPAADKEKDIAIYILSDKTKIQEGDNTSITFRYMNKTDVPIHDVTITIELPKEMTIKDAIGGKIKGNEITWSIGELKGFEKASVSFKVQIEKLDAIEKIIELKAYIKASDKLIKPEDDSSRLKILLFSKGDVSHKRYIKGYTDNTFRPNSPITRGEIAAIFARIMNLESTIKGEQLYKDVDNNYWAAEYIEAVTKKGLFKGTSKDSFEPAKPITRAEVATVIARYLGTEKDKDLGYAEEVFRDIDGNWAEGSIKEIYRYGVLKGYADGTFKPSSTIRRSECVAMINRMLFRGPLINAKPSFKDMSEDEWSLGDVEEASRTHEAQIKQTGKENMTKYIPEPLW